MGVAQKFLFDLSFDAPAAEPAAVVEEPPQAISPEELTAARAAGFEEGRRTALADAAAAQDAAIAATLPIIADRLTALLSGLDDIRDDSERAAAELAVAIARKFVPALTRRGALDEVTALAAECLREALHEPRVAVRVPDAVFEAIRDRLDALKTAAGFEGRIVVLAEETMQGADCRIEWADGGAERDEARLWREIDAAVERNLTPRPAAAPGPDTTLTDTTLTTMTQTGVHR